jgi:hypothetical protein
MKGKMDRAQQREREAIDRWNADASSDDIYRNSESARCENPAPHSNRFDHDPMVIGLRGTDGLPRRSDGSVDNKRWIDESNAGWGWRNGKWEPPR